jgi:predicted ferric reductase
MNRTIVGVFWLVAYLAVILLPLAIMMVPPTPAARPFWVEFSLGLGFVGVLQIAVQFVLVARYSNVTAPYGIDLILKYHRQVATIAVVLIVAHPVILVIQNPNLLGLLNPFGGTMASRVGNAALYTLVLLALLSAFRRRIGLPYELWRVSHAILGIGAIVLAHWHIVLVGHYTGTAWKEIVLIAVSATMVTSFAYLRLVRPALMRRRPYRVAEVTAERGGTWSLSLAPVGHRGMRFSPGQFAWLKLGDSPYTIEEHPFSFSSSAQDAERIEFGIKELGDFTGNVGKIEVGTTAYVDGPHGSFSPDHEPAAGYVFFAGGVGITPFISMLRTMADRGDRRPVTLFYGDPTWDGIAFREEIERLQGLLDLTVVFVLEKPPEGWEGESGFIDADVLKRHLPSSQLDRLHLICGPIPMIDAVEAALQQRGVPMQRIRSERFDLV